MKPPKSYILLFVGLICGYLIGSHSAWQFNQPTPAIPGWYTTISTNQGYLGFLLSSLAIIAVGMVTGRAIPFLKNYFTMESIAVVNIGIAVVGMANIVGWLVELSVSWYSGYMYELIEFQVRERSWVGLIIIGVSVVASQLFWIGIIRQNPVWTVAIALFIVLGSYL